jgi:N-acetylglutamate synthase-like GNAT family acetyltransferase
VKIASLKDKPEHLLPLATWHHAEWSYLNPLRSFDQRVEEMREDLEGKAIPTTYVAEENDELLGSACILADDMSSHPELTPWLASVYVNQIHRGKGIGSTLVKRIMQHAQENGVKRLYLYTPDQEQLYARLGWQLFSREPYNGTPVTIMSMDF